MAAAYALNDVGWIHALLGEHRRAVDLCTRALDELRPFGHRYGEAATWDSLGYAYRGLGDHDNAQSCYRRATDLFEELDDRGCLADALTNLGDAYLAAGRPEEARETWRRALRVLEQRVRADTGQLLARLDQPVAEGLTTADVET
jgi:tetratricopeptide (TPR) repeat protein